MKVLNSDSKTGNSKIFIGEKLSNSFKYITANDIVVITDVNVNRIYKDEIISLFDKSKKVKIIEINTGESIKTLETVSYIIDKLVSMGADRSTFLLGIGGGIVCDITGFVASIFMRGINFGFVSTTLLSQVDASLGGKNGVNFDAYKNMVGIFNQPSFVICDLELLKTLPERELRSGFAEIVKHGVIKNFKHFEYLEKSYSKALQLDNDVMEKLIYDSVSLKLSVVKTDEREKGERKILNFGHTIGHAVERTFGIIHGEAVSYGIVLACEISVYLNLLSKEDSLRIKKLLKNINLPVSLDEVKVLSTKNINNILDLLKEAILHDKKRNSGTIDFILITSIGKSVIKKIEISELSKILDKLIDNNK